MVGTKHRSKRIQERAAFGFREGKGELLVHSLLPVERMITRRGGPGNEFYTPGDDHGGPWGSGENWPLVRRKGAHFHLTELIHMWKTFWETDFKLSEISPSNRKNVVPGAWRIEVSPLLPSKEDLFLHVLEIGNTGTTAGKRIEVLQGENFTGAICEHEPCVLFSTSDSATRDGEVSLPDMACSVLLLTGLNPDCMYELSFNGPNVTSSNSAALPGVYTVSSADTFESTRHTATMKSSFANTSSPPHRAGLVTGNVGHAIGFATRNSRCGRIRRLPPGLCSGRQPSVALRFRSAFPFEASEHFSSRRRVHVSPSIQVEAKPFIQRV